MSSGGGCNTFQVPSHTGGGHQELLSAFPYPWLFGPLLVVVVIAVPLLWLVYLYLSGRMRFILFDSVVAKRWKIGLMWRRRGEPAMRYFVWQIVLSLVSLAGMALIIGVPALIAFSLGWFTEPRNHLVGLISVGLFVFFAFMGWVLLALLTHVFSKDFVVPQMALENISAFEGWSRLWRMLQSEKAGDAGYAGMKRLLAIAAGMSVGIVAIILLVILLIPIVRRAATAVLCGSEAS